MKNVKGYPELVAEFRRRREPVMAPEEAAKRLQALGRKGLKEALDNDLDEDQNRELFETTDSYRTVELILMGLKKRFGGKKRK